MQIISVHIGQCGVQIGSALWELLTFEHSLDNDGILNQNEYSKDESLDSFFIDCRKGQFVPRVLFIDLEPNVIDEIKTGSYRKLFHPNQLISGNEDAANNFARGFHTAGRIIKVLCEQRLRKAIEMCGHLQAFHIYRSLGGGTGSGMTAIMFEILSEFTKTTKLEIPIHPSPHLSSAIVEPYNCILTEHFCMDDIDVSLLMDNEALYDILTNEISIKEPRFSHINRIVAQICSSMTSSARFSTDLYNDFVVLTNLVPYPRIHYPLVSYAPFGNSMKLERDMNSVTEITKAVFNSNNQLVKCDPAYGKYMSCSLLYRGNVSPVEVYAALAEIKSFNTVHFVDWCPTGFKVGIVNQKPSIIQGSQIGVTSQNVIMLTNNSAVSTVWHRLSQKFHHLYSKRSFIHWFIGEGLEECEFCESLFNIATLAKDYEEVSLDTEIAVSEDQTKSTTLNKTRLNDVKIILDKEVKLSKNSVDSEVSNPTFEKFIKVSEENVKENTLHEETPQEETLQEIHQEVLQEENPQKLALQQDVIQETPQEVALEEESSQEVVPQNETPHDGSSTEETPMEDTTDITETTDTNEETETEERHNEENNKVNEDYENQAEEEQENEDVNNYEPEENKEDIENNDNEELEDENEEPEDANEEPEDANEEPEDANEEPEDANEELEDANEEPEDANEEPEDDDEENNNNNNNRNFENKIINSSLRKSGNREQKSEDEIIKILIRELSSKLSDNTSTEQSPFEKPKEKSLYETNVFYGENSPCMKMKFNSQTIQIRKDQKPKRSIERRSEENVCNTDEKVIHSLMEELIRITAEISL